MATDDNTIKDAAFAYAEAGMRVIPLWAVDENGACRCPTGADCRSQGKHPISPGWQKAPRVKDEYMEAMFKGRNIGISTGKDSGVFVLDIDPGNNGFESARALAEEHGSFFDSTARIKTGSGGYHLYYSLPDFEVRNSASKIGQGIDIRGEGGQVVAPPSTSSKGSYKLDNEIDISPAPQWLLAILAPKPVTVVSEVVVRPEPESTGDVDSDRLLAYSRGVVTNETGRLAALTTWEDGTAAWNTTTFEVSCNLIQLANAEWSHIDVAEARRLVFSETPEWESGFDEAVVDRTFRSALTTIGDKQTDAPAGRDGIPDFMFGADVTEELSPSEVLAILDEVPVAVFSIPEFAGVPIEGNTLSPSLALVTAAEEMGRKFRLDRVDSQPSTGRAALADFIDQVDGGFPGDTAAVDEWIAKTLRAGTPQLFWEVLGYLIDGEEPFAKTISIKGCSGILSLFSDRFRPPLGSNASGILFGPQLRPGQAVDMTLAFALVDIDVDLAGYLSAIVYKALEAWALARARGHFYSHPTSEVDDSEDSVKRSRRGRVASGREISEEEDGVKI